MLTIYKLYIRSILEQSCVIWHSSLSEENKEDLERVQKNALRNILKEKYSSYKDLLKLLNLETLDDRRKKLLLVYGKQCTKIEQTKQLFPLKKKHHNMNTPSNETYEVLKTNTTRYRNSTVPFIQKLLNAESEGGGYGEHGDETS